MQTFTNTNGSWPASPYQSANNFRHFDNDDVPVARTFPHPTATNFDQFDSDTLRVMRAPSLLDYEEYERQEQEADARRMATDANFRAGVERHPFMEYHHLQEADHHRDDDQYLNDRRYAFQPVREYHEHYHGDDHHLNDRRYALQPVRENDERYRRDFAGGRELFVDEFGVFFNEGNAVGNGHYAHGYENENEIEQEYEDDTENEEEHQSGDDSYGDEDDTSGDDEAEDDKNDVSSETLEAPGSSEDNPIELDDESEGVPVNSPAVSIHSPKYSPSRSADPDNSPPHTPFSRQGDRPSSVVSPTSPPFTPTSPSYGARVDPDIPAAAPSLVAARRLGSPFSRSLRLRPASTNGQANPRQALKSLSPRYSPNYTPSSRSSSHAESDQENVPPPRVQQQSVPARNSFESSHVVLESIETPDTANSNKRKRSYEAEEPNKKRATPESTRRGHDNPVPVVAKPPMRRSLASAGPSRRNGKHRAIDSEQSTARVSQASPLQENEPLERGSPADQWAVMLVTTSHDRETAVPLRLPIYREGLRQYDWERLFNESAAAWHLYNEAIWYATARVSSLPNFPAMIVDSPQQFALLQQVVQNEETADGRFPTVHLNMVLRI